MDNSTKVLRRYVVDTCGKTQYDESGITTGTRHNFSLRFALHESGALVVSKKYVKGSNNKTCFVVTLADGTEKTFARKLTDLVPLPSGHLELLAFPEKTKKRTPKGWKSVGYADSCQA